MALGWQGAVQRDLLISWHGVPVTPGQVFYDRLSEVLDAAGFDREVEALCAPRYARGVGRPSVPPGRYFRMLLVGYFEGLESPRGIAWRCADSLSLRQFLKLGTSEAVPDHSTLARTPARLPLEVHDAVLALVLEVVAEHGLVKGRRVGIDTSTMEANAAMRSIVRRADGARWQAMLGELAQTSGIPTPTTGQLRQFDRTRAGKRVSNADRVSPTDPEASWHGDHDARPAVYANRARLLSGVARGALILRAILCERTFARVLDRGGMQRTWLRGRDNAANRYLIQVAGHNLGLLMSALLGAGTPRAVADLRLLWLAPRDRLLLVLLAPPEPEITRQAAVVIITVTANEDASPASCAPLQAPRDFRSQDE